MPENGIACNCHMARKLLNNKNSFYERVEFTKILGTKPHKLPHSVAHTEQKNVAVRFRSYSFYLSSSR